jgi:hypothetical protein
MADSPQKSAQSRRRARPGEQAVEPLYEHGRVRDPRAVRTGGFYSIIQGKKGFMHMDAFSRRPLANAMLRDGKLPQPETSASSLAY